MRLPCSSSRVKEMSQGGGSSSTVGSNSYSINNYGHYPMNNNYHHHSISGPGPKFFSKATTGTKTSTGSNGGGSSSEEHMHSVLHGPGNSNHHPDINLNNQSYHYQLHNQNQQAIHNLVQNNHGSNNNMAMHHQQQHQMNNSNYNNQYYHQPNMIVGSNNNWINNNQNVSYTNTMTSSNHGSGSSIYNLTQQSLTTNHVPQSAVDPLNPRGIVVSDQLLTDPVPHLAPKSKKMALGSITFSSEQGKELGVPTKDNSFFLRVEKCDPRFCEELNFQVEKLYQVKLPDNVEDKAEYWPEGALFQYCQAPNQRLQQEMTRVYRLWHDQRCGMEQLYQRLCAVKHQYMN